ncbi:SDR family oxidoreductase [Arthrobacter sp. zg-Y40]|uniref:SDR family NAD(P)-dependent oxidoreductase n=1 Tax=unclassified Arthrobacter TaxID=235627 RepID=UPI001D15857A|nr:MULTISPECIES: SDR family oxidoreductase [unclassified Arthrobacter]MCC3280509.1 SDR family oxidoreductase [Arthrobacter sp. zg-Y40]MDK1329119.1 SDR family oxidoreductase [Arthrobacter sp. zg-Y1143]
MGRLENKVALVTGGTQGIGLATAVRFAAEGAQVYVTGRRQHLLDDAVRQIGHGATGVLGDISSDSDLDDLFATVEAGGRGLDVLFANAGGGEFARLADLTRGHLEDTFRRNVFGTVFTVQKALPLLNRGASVILSGSTSATNGTPAFSAYAASKAAIRSFGRTWAAELADAGIRVNTLIPGSTETPGLRGLASGPVDVGVMLKEMTAAAPMGRVGRPEEIAAVALFLASEDSSFMTGGEVFVDGGSEQI